MAGVARWAVRAALAVAALAAAGPARAGQYVVVVGVKDHEDAKLNLDHTRDDAVAVRQLLIERGKGIDPQDTLILVDGGGGDRTPTRKNITEQVPAFLRKMTADDRVVVFFSGHGVVQGGATYLVPRDFARDNPAGTGVPLPEVQGWLKACPAKSKLLVLDCCHAGNPGPTGTTAEEVAAGIDPEAAENCYILAACSRKESSYEWKARQHGVFTYWLCRALEGAAAGSGGEVTLTEIVNYLRGRVDGTARLLNGGRSQTPRLIGRFTGDEVVLELKPERVETVCRRAAEHVDLEVARRKWKRVGVLEFAQPVGGLDKLGFGSLPRTAAEQVAAQLASLAGGAYQVVGPAAAGAAAKGMSLVDVYTPQRVRQMEPPGGPLDAVAFGTLRPGDGHVEFECALVPAAGGAKTPLPRGLIARTPGVRVDAGESYAPPARPAGADAPPDRHPAFDPNAPVALRVVVAGRRRDPVAVGADAYIGVKEGEPFHLELVTRYPHRLGAALLLDGVNSVGKRRETSDAARLWVLDPPKPGEAEKVYVIDGFHVPLPDRKGGRAGFRVEPFAFTKASNSVAARQGFEASVGSISLVAYGGPESAKSRDAQLGSTIGIGTRPEDAYDAERETATFQRGGVVGGFSIRYAEAGAVPAR